MPPGLWSVFVDGIMEEISYRRARSFFDRLEGIKRMFIQKNKKDSRRFKFGFLRFREYEKAYNAIRKLNGVRFLGAYLSLKMARQRHEKLERMERLPESRRASGGEKEKGQKVWVKKRQQSENQPTKVWVRKRIQRAEKSHKEEYAFIYCKTLFSRG